MAQILSASNENIAFLSGKLLGGELVAVPTETVYGLAANALDAAACARIFHAKRRPAFDPLSVHLPVGFALAEVADPTPLAKRLMAAFWPGPLTLVLKKRPIIPDIVTAGLSSVAVRTPRHPVFQQLLAACGVPLAAPSANPFGYVSPTTAQHVADSLDDEIPYILDGGPCEIGLESTIVDVRDPAKPVLLRHGAIPREEISRVLRMPVTDPAEGGAETMPGQLEQHYSPRSRCRLLDRIEPDSVFESESTAFVFFRKPPGANEAPPANLFWLSETGDDVEAARRLFDVLRRIDSLNFESLVVEKAPDEGLGLAINDRLRRASAGGAEESRT